MRFEIAECVELGKYGHKFHGKKNGFIFWFFAKELPGGSKFTPLD